MVPHLKIDARLETESGLAVLPVGPHGGLSLSGTLYLTGTVANTHPELTAHGVQIELRLFRKKDDPKHERWYRYYAIPELAKIPPGGSAKFRQYVKQTMSGYERCEVLILEAKGRK